RKASDLTEIGPHQLKANVIFAPGTSRAVKGQITIFRDKDRYRSELQIQNFHESRWITDNTLYIGRSQPLRLPRTTLLRQLDRLWRPSPLPGDAKISKSTKHKQHGEGLECAVKPELSSMFATVNMGVSFVIFITLLSSSCGSRAGSSTAQTT